MELENEKINYFDENRKYIGQVDRKNAEKNSLLVQAVQLWIVNPETNEVLMQKRSDKKNINAGKIDVSVSGHVKIKETPIQAMLREANEEIGIDRQYLCNAMQKFYETKINLGKYGKQGNYIVNFYVAFLNNELSSYKKNDDEVEKLFWMKYEELKKRVENNDNEILIPKSKESEIFFKELDKIIKERNQQISSSIRRE